MSFLDTLPEMDAEYEAWQDFVTEWRALGLPDMDECDPLIRAIELWGERLAAFRLVQTPEQRATALADHVKSYEEAKIERGPIPRIDSNHRLQATDTEEER